MPFNNCQGPNTDMAPADAIIAPPGVPVVAPNSVLGVMKIPSQFKVFHMMAMFAHNLLTIAPMTIGPAPGAPTCLMKCQHLKGSMKFFPGGLPATRLGDPTTQNMVNTMGATGAPGQVGTATLS